MKKSLKIKRIKNILFLSIILIALMIPKHIFAENKVLLGDINQDKIINSNDLLMMSRHIVAKANNKHQDWILKENRLKSADINKDGKVDTNDMLSLLRYIAAKQDTNNIGKKHPEWLKLEKEIEIEVKGISLNKTDIELENGKKATLTATIEPGNATNKEITWTSSNKKVAEVDKNGKITGKTNGTAIITAKSKNGKTATCNITVKTSPTGINLTKTEVTLVKDEKNKETLFANISPYKTTDDQIEWTNNNQSVVAIERIIEEGTYYIKSAIDENKVIEVVNSLTANSAKIQLYDKTSSEKDNQKFEIINKGNGYYTIKAMHSNKMLDVKGAGKTKGTKVQQYNSNNSDAQKWEFEYAGNGYYYIKSKCNGLYLDVKDAKAVNGTQIQVWTENRSNAQKFKLEQIAKKNKAVKNGTYYIKTAINERKILEIENGNTTNSVKVQLNDNKGSESQKFEIIGIGNGYYVIRAKHSGKSIDVKGAEKTKGTKVQQYNFNGTDAQIWKLESAGNGYYYIKSKCNGLYLDVKDAKAINGTQIQVWTGNKTIAQKFKIERLDENVNNNIEFVTIKQKKNGTATITAKTSNGKKATCNITVKDEKITGGQAIAEAAVKLACSADPENRFRVEWPYTCVITDRTKEYVNARKTLIAGKSNDGGEYASCDIAVAVAVRYSGLDKSMEYNTTPKQWEYLKKSNKWKRIGDWVRGSNTIGLQPGDILISSGHMSMYVGNETVKKKYPNSKAIIYEAGYWTIKNMSYYPHLCTATGNNTQTGNVFTIFRHVNANKKIYNKILK